MNNVCRFCMKYYPNIHGGVCPECGGIFENIEIDEFEYTRDDRSDSGASSSFESDFDDSFSSAEDDWTDTFDDELTPYSPHQITTRSTARQSANRRINGVVVSYSESKERRFLVNKIIDALWYGQCFSDTYYSFMIKDLHNGQTYNMTAYGKISGHGAKPIKDQHVTVDGKQSRNGIFFVSRMQVDSGSMSSDVIFYNDYEPSGLASRGYSHGPNRFLARFLSTLLLILLLVLGYLYIPAVRDFISIWVLATVILGAVASIFFKRSLLNRPSTLLALGLVVTLAINNVGGLGSAFSSLFAALGPSVVTIIIMLFGLSLIIKGFKN